MKNVSESLAGRAGIVNLLGLSDAEIYQDPSEPFQTDAQQLMNRLSVRSRKGLNEIYGRIFKDSMPELYADKNVDLETYYRSEVFFESYVFSEIYKSYLNAGKEPPIFYYRDKNKKEIDLLIYQNGVLSPIEIKKSESPGKTTIKNFKVLEPITHEENFSGLESLKVEIGTGSVVCMANDFYCL